MNNLVKLAANTDVLRRFARRHIWNAPHRDFGEDAGLAMSELPRLRRKLRVAERGALRYEQELPMRRAEAERVYQEQLREHAQRGEQQQQGGPADWQRSAQEEAGGRSAKVIDPGAARRQVDRYLVAINGGQAAPPAARPAPRLEVIPEQSDDHHQAEMLRRRLDAMQGRALSPAAYYSPILGRVSLHGAQSGPGARLSSALHENNEREAHMDMLRKLRIDPRDQLRRRLEQEPEPRHASDVLSQSSHMTPSVPLRDVNIANTAWGPEAAEIQDKVRRSRLVPRGGFPVSEIREIGYQVPGAQRILENARILPGAPVPATPGYVQHAQQRLVGAGSGAPPSPAVQQRLQQIVDTHQANVTPTGPARLNRNELRMIDDSFHRTYNPQFPQLLARRAPSLQTPATPLPAEQRDAFREALTAQPGLTRKQFLARPPEATQPFVLRPEPRGEMAQMIENIRRAQGGEG